MFRAAAPAAIATCTGMALGYFVYKQFVNKWYGESRNFHTTEKIKYWLGVLSCFSIAQGFMQISGEFFYVAFNESSIRGDIVYKGIHTFIVLPLILSAIGFFISLIFGKPIKASHTANDEYYAEALRELENRKQVDGLWARCLANSEGNDSKAKSEYIRLRAIELSQETLNIKSASSVNGQKKIDVANAIRKQNNSLFFGAAICIAITLGLWVYLISFHTNSNNELGNLVRNALNIKPQRVQQLSATEQPNDVKEATPKQDDGTVSGKSIKICQLYWNGWDLVQGDKSNEKPEFITFSFSRYDLKTLEISFPNDMVGDANKQEFGENFLNQRLDLVMKLCSLN